ncbi:MAG: YfhO family protein, partial [Oscillospiraceae bacterium]|nr:YfhO family protein [Oscillospiraceae bacterium]
YVNEDALGFAYLADSGVIGAKLEDRSPFSSQERLAAWLSGDVNRIYIPIDEYATDLINLNAGSTTDNHLSYNKRLEGEAAFVKFLVTPLYSGKVYMYLSSLYERECRLYVNGEFIKYYFENENHSIAYLGDFEGGDTFEVQLELLRNDAYFEHPLFYTLDEESLARFSEKMQSLNADTVVTRMDKAALSISVNAQKDCALFTTIPVEEGWTATIDGVPAEILTCANQTLMCLEVPSGSHTIELTFKLAGFKTGLIISIGGAVMFAAMLVISAAMKRPRGDNGEPELEDPVGELDEYPEDPEDNESIEEDDNG